MSAHNTVVLYSNLFQKDDDLVQWVIETGDELDETCSAKQNVFQQCRIESSYNYREKARQKST